MQIARSSVERYAHWLTYDELAHICAAPRPFEEHSRLCARVLMRSAVATCLGEGVQLSVRNHALAMHPCRAVVRLTLQLQTAGQLAAHSLLCMGHHRRMAALG